VFPEPEDIGGPWHGWIVHPGGRQRVQVELTYDGFFQFQGTYSFPPQGAKEPGLTASLISPLSILQVNLDQKDSHGPLEFPLHILIGRTHKMMYGAIPPAAAGRSPVPFATVTMFPGKVSEKPIASAWQEFFTEVE
jgi:hypothetical protein